MNKSLTFPSTKDTIGCATEVIQPKITKPFDLTEQIIKNLLKDMELKTKTGTGTGYHGSSKGETFTYTEYYDVYRYEWTTMKNRAVEGHILNKLSPTIKKLTK
jgi:uncharacterized protein (DUF488 family)